MIYLKVAVCDGSKTVAINVTDNITTLNAIPLRYVLAKHVSKMNGPRIVPILATEKHVPTPMLRFSVG